MSIKKYLSYSSVILALFVFAGTAAAQNVGNVMGSGSTTSTLTMTATVQTALNLEISKHAAGAAVGGTEGSGVYDLDFGNVNGLGLGTPADDVTATAVTGGVLYTTPIVLTATYSGFAGEAASIKVHQPAADGAAAVDMAREGASASILSGTLPASAATATAFNSAVTNGQSIDRYVGVLVRNANAGATDEAGTRTMHLVYTISVP